MAKDNTGSLEVLKWILEEYKKRGLNYENIFNVFACAPLIDPVDLTKSYKKYIKFNKKYPLYVVSKYKVPVEWALRAEKHLLKAHNLNTIRKNSNNFEEKYYESGPFTIFHKNHILNKNKIFKDYFPLHYEIPNHKSVDIDNLDDWKFAEILFKGNK